MTFRLSWAARDLGRATLITVAALFLAWIGVRDALVQSLARARPDFVLQLDPTNAVALNTRFRQMLKPTASAAWFGNWAARARASLSASPLNSATVRMVATDPARKDTGALLALAERVSRRDALTQLALIETSVSANRIDAALAHYDHALSIYPDLRPLLFPVLTSALTETEVRRGVAGLARRQRPWVDPFLESAVRETTAPEAVAALLASVDSGRNALGSAKLYEAALASRMAGQGRYGEARRLAMRSVGPNSGVIDAAGIGPATWGMPTRPLTWAAGESDGVDVELEDERSVLVTVRPGGSGLAVYRVLVRPPGRYRFTAGAAAPSDGIEIAGGRWDLVCLREDDRPASNLTTLNVDAKEPAPVMRSIIVPSGCAAVRIGFTIDNIDGGADAGLVLRDVSFASLR
ncbi:hypothetical protein [uncultured Sphingomonas sp.]|uniref:hypothetical protein n=1 Tax=uncultured Sphingomonas sp. TaxID=158754 RepID=UPI0035CC43AC